MDNEPDYEKGAGQPSEPFVRGEDPSRSVPAAPNASELSAMLNQLDQEKEENEFEIFDL